MGGKRLKLKDLLGKTWTCFATTSRRSLVEWLVN
jgi:hypothetical protein